MKKSPNLIKKYRWILFVIIVLIVSFLGVVKWTESKWLNIPIMTKYEKTKECKNLILEQLKSPTTAKFSNISYMFKWTSTGSWEHIEDLSWAIMSTKIQSWWLFWIYSELSGKISSWVAKIQSWGYIKTQLKNNEIISENKKALDDIGQKARYYTRTSEFNEAKRKSIELWNSWESLIYSNMAISIAMKSMSYVTLSWNIDSQNWYWAMVRSKFHCDQIMWEDMYGELYE